eukprot:gnl/TRDRNA2_/TRDRNA2_139405_c0_seq1.p1 gnl/TRDRNA2_/TRDRNA2_139405_c0~~gnl/TRDRNA2_/TRDRNA2_139405_c0_seq1.p1  ORF type:complete len:103 (+),score=21.20 gnl/TRDRNA2_/TRDRNA2_139405_c0_seq1:42-311(+)
MLLDGFGTDTDDSMALDEEDENQTLEAEMEDRVWDDISHFTEGRPTVPLAAPNEPLLNVKMHKQPLVAQVQRTMSHLNKLHHQLARASF